MPTPVFDAAAGLRQGSATAFTGPAEVVPRRPWPVRRFGTLAVAALVLTAAAGALLAWKGVLRPAATPAARAAMVKDPALRALVARCRIAMAGGVCRAMPATSNPASASVSAPAGPVFIVGFGPVDGQIVARLNGDGEAMCDTVASTCQSSPGDELCRVARALYP